MNFTWIINNELAALECPRTKSDLLFVTGEGVRHLVTLSPETPPSNEAVPNLNRTNIYVEEFEPPTLEQILQFLTICKKCRKDSLPVGVHCRMGRGRTGVMVACYLVRFHDIAPEMAIIKIRLLRPGSIETQQQERAVLHYHDYYMKTKSDELISKVRD